MAKLFNCKCPECGHDIETDIKPHQASVVCPACKKNVPLPAGGKGAKLLLMIGGAIAVIITILVIIVFIRVQGKRIENERAEAKRAASAARRLKEVKRIQVEDAEKRRWSELKKRVDRSNLKNEDDFYRAFSALEKYRDGDPDDLSALRVQLEKFKDDDIKLVMVGLDAKAKSFCDKNDFLKAVAVYQDYDLDFKEETEEPRKRGAKIYFDKADAAKLAEKLAEKKALQEAKNSLDELVVGLLAGKMSDALSKFNSSPYKKNIPEIVKVVDNLNNINEIVINSFKADIGKKITVALKTGNTIILVKKVEKGRVYGAFKKAKLTMTKKYTIKDMDESEIMKRLTAFDKKTVALLKGIKAVKKRKFDLAEDLFQDTGAFAIPLMGELEKLREKMPAAARRNETGEGKFVDPGAVDIKKLKINVKITKGGKKNLDMGEVRVKLNARFSVVNNTGREVDGYTLIIYIIGESLKVKRSYKIIREFKENIKLAYRKKFVKKYPFINTYFAGGDINFTDDRVRFFSKGGYKSYSWLYVLRNPGGEIKVVKSKHNKFEKNFQKILGTLGKGKEKDKKNNNKEFH